MRVQLTALCGAQGGHFDGRQACEQNPLFGGIRAFWAYGQLGRVAQADLNRQVISLVAHDARVYSTFVGQYGVEVLKARN